MRSLMVARSTSGGVVQEALEVLHRDVAAERLDLVLDGAAGDDLEGRHGERRLPFGTSWSGRAVPGWTGRQTAGTLAVRRSWLILPFSQEGIRLAPPATTPTSTNSCQGV